METFINNTWELILLTASAVLFIIQLGYYFGLYNRIHRHNMAYRKGNIHFTQELPPISVVICARNESENLLHYLPAILEQDYPEFEVIVINDGSTDESEAVLAHFEKQYRHLYHSFTPENARYISRKKLALTLGIKASKHDWLVFTEADCTPSSNQWLRLMARNFTSRTEIVLGYSRYERSKGWLHRYIAFDTFFTTLRYLGFALAKHPYMGIGRNMAYRKELFFRQKGYSTHLNLQRGEDDLFINQVGHAGNTRIETHANATIKMKPSERYKDWKEEKVSYQATSRYYKGMQKYLLGLETTSRLLFHTVVTATITLAILHTHFLSGGIVLSFWLTRYIIQLITINQTAVEQGESWRYYLSLPLFDLILPIQTLKLRLYRIYRGKSDFMRR